MKNMNQTYVKKITPNKSQIRTMLGRWSPKSHSHAIQTVVTDIQEKTKNHQIGEYHYWTEQRIGRRVVRYEYRLFIEDQEIFFLDLYHNHYYIIKTE